MREEFEQPASVDLVESITVIEEEDSHSFPLVI